VGGTAIESPATVAKKLGRPEMENQKWEAIVKDWGKVPPGKGNQGTKPSRVCRHDEGKAGREESRKAVRSATQEHCKENSGV